MGKYLDERQLRLGFSPISGFPASLLLIVAVFFISLSAATQVNAANLDEQFLAAENFGRVAFGLSDRRFHFPNHPTFDFAISSR